MADNTNPINPSNVTDAEAYLRNLLEIRDVSRDITSFTKELSKSAGTNGEINRDLLSIHRSVSKVLQEQSRNIVSILDNEKKTKDIVKDIQKNRLLINRLKDEESRIAIKLGNLATQQQMLEDLKVRRGGVLNQIEQARLDKINEQYDATKKINTALLEQIDHVEELNEGNELAKKISEAADKKSGGFENLSKVVKSIPGLKGLSEPFEKAAKASRESALSGKGMVANTLAGGKSLVSGLGSFLKGPIWLTLLVEAAKFFLDAMFEADKNITNISKNLLISKKEAEGVYNSFKFTKDKIDSIYNSTKAVNEAWSDLAGLTEFTVNATEDQINAQIILTKNLGLSKEQALGVQEAFASSNIEATKGKDIAYDQIAAFTNQNKLIITGKNIFSDIAKTSKLIQINFNGNLGSLVKTTLEAKKLGLTLDQVSKIGASLLDFESSISSQIEAELLTGKQLNLEKARLFALNHDIAGLTEEITKQGITQEKFAAMNAIQQESIAKSLGMSASELGDALYKQQVIEKTAGNVTKQMKEQARISNDMGLMKKAEAIEAGILTGKTLEEAEKSNTAQEKFEQSLERVKEIFSDLVTGGTLDAFANFAKQLADNLSKGEGVLSWLLGVKPDPNSQKVMNKGLSNTGVSQTEIKSIEKDEVTYAPMGQKFAKGGIITKPINNATIGEAGAEAVIPINQLLDKFNKLDETNALLRQLLAKDTNLYVDYDKFATAGSRQTYSI